MINLMDRISTEYSAPVDIKADARVGDIETVNGGISMRTGSQADDVSTVNGGIRLRNKCLG